MPHPDSQVALDVLWSSAARLSLRRPSSTPWKTVALEIVEGLGKAVVLIVSTVAVVVSGTVLAAMSSLP